MAQEEKDRRKAADLQEEEKVRNGSSRLDDQDRRLSRPFGPRQRRKHQEESTEVGVRFGGLGVVPRLSAKFSVVPLTLYVLLSGMNGNWSLNPAGG